MKDPEGSVSAFQDRDQEDDDRDDRSDEYTDKIDQCVKEHIEDCDVLDDGVASESVAEEHPYDTDGDTDDEHDDP